ncbi:MAG: hypothetical protein KY460_17305 [Actinobacteria bacterium]|nr:hypothetical protein [Actinomycetota bacterium]
MRRFALLLLVVVLTLGLSVPALAHEAGPCDDSDGDLAPSGREYAAHHIVSLAQVGGLGDGGHKPGSHQGFSLCDPSGL